MDQSLLVFTTVVEKKNFTKAADALHMTQPAVSQYIKMLEGKVGTKLLERSNKHVQLNKAGEIVYHHATEILGLYTQMQNLVDDTINKASGSLAIGASYTFGEYVLPHIISYLKVRYPLIKPKITIANTRRIAEWVTSRQLDIGIIDGDVQQSCLPIESFADDLMYIVASANNPYVYKDTFHIKDLENETWILREESSGTRTATAQLFSSLNFSPKNIMEFGSTQIIKESVHADLGITLLSQYTIQKELSLGTLRILKVAGTPYFRKFSFVTPSTRFKTKATTVFIDILRTGQGLPYFFYNYDKSGHQESQNSFRR